MSVVGSIFCFQCTEKRVCADLLEDEPQWEAKTGGNDSMGFTCMTTEDRPGRGEAGRRGSGIGSWRGWGV